jgi:hypothetical protein
VVSTANSEQRFTITVAGAAQPSFKTVPHTSVKEIKAKEFVFVGHANLDGYDVTAAAKRGIDRVVAEARKNRVPVVYWVSNEYPNWYTRIVTRTTRLSAKGRTADLHVDSSASRSRGSFMRCRCKKCSNDPHGMVKHDAQRVNFVFPIDAIWVEDLDRGDKRWYPTPRSSLVHAPGASANDTRNMRRSWSRF